MGSASAQMHPGRTPNPSLKITHVTPRDYLSDWLRLWNGRLDLIDEVIHSQFAAHNPGNPDFGRDHLRAVIAGLRSHFDVFSVKADLGPVAQGDLVAGRWIAVAVSAGEASHWVGQSIFRIADEQIVEHWEVNVQIQGLPFDISGISPVPQP